MKKIYSILLLLAITTVALAQKQTDAFCAYLYNNEYDVYLRIDLRGQTVTIPGQELYGQLPGYLGKKNNSFCWPIVTATIESERQARLQLVNDFGSEDLTATLTLKQDSIYVLRQQSGSALKVPNNGKWLKLPRTLEFRKRQ